ncbi:DUF998 domain-containing protein [Specibacter cremeus]|uniref:DUF998 domain-containing protein n=1 Tax=Specibacter cremeus TaxID=1629051 RepID=UPI00197B5B5B|nr:DUF998 domain-containing protein [Specibacter cremeus]
MIAVAELAFTAAYWIEGFTRPGYNWPAESMSLLSLGPGGWMMQINCVALGVLSLGAALVWRRILRPGRAAAAFPICQALLGIGLLGIGLFSQDPTAAYPPGGQVPVIPSLHGDLHNVFAGIAVTAIAVSAFALARRLAVEPGWGAPWAAYAVATGIMTVGFMTGFGVAGGQGGFAGLFERLAIGVGLPLLGAVVTARLLWQARGR